MAPPESPTDRHDQDSNQPRWFEQFWVISLATFLLFSLLFAMYLHIPKGTDSQPTYIALFFKEAAFACLVAFFLNVSIEWVNRKRHQLQEEKLVQHLDMKHKERQDELLKSLDERHSQSSLALLKDVFRTVYERNIEPGVFKVVDNHVLRRDVMRKGYRVTLKISPSARQGSGQCTVQGANELVDLTFQIEFEVVNLRQIDIDTLLLGAMIDVVPSHDSMCRFVKAEVGGQSYEAEALERYTTFDEDESLRTLRITGCMKPAEAIKVMLIYTKVAPRNYSEVICSTVQMDGLKLDVYLEDETLAVHAISLHPEDAVATENALFRRHSSWKIPHAILPGQGAVLFWHPRRSAGSNQHAARLEG